MIKFSNFFKVFVVCHVLMLQITGTLAIKGGQDEDIYNIPSLLQLLVNEKFICAATLVADQYAITAAHCFHGIDFKLGHALTVKAGVSTLKETGIQVNVSKIITHKDFKYSTFDKDVAILELKKPIKGSSVKPATFCSQGLRSGETIQVYGWGQTSSEGTKLSNQLQVTNLKVISNETCQKKYDGRREVTQFMFCAAQSGRSTCYGDGGGPVIKNGEFCGIISWSDGCALKNSPEVYTNLRKIRKFIKQNIPNVIDNN